MDMSILSSLRLSSSTLAIDQNRQSVSNGGAQQAEVKQCIKNFEGKTEDQLTLKVGDMVTVYECSDQGWCRGEVNQKVGWFPMEVVGRTAAPPASATILDAAAVVCRRNRCYSCIPFNVYSRKSLNWLRLQ